MATGTTHRSVGRPREFDEDAVLRSAMQAFWEKGYEATSLTELCNCTGLHKGSLYQAFGGKKELFMRALQHYADDEFREVATVAFDSESPLENIRAAVKKIWEIASEDRGCLVINSMVELAPHDPDVKAVLQAAGEKRLRVMGDMLAKAQAAGEVRKDLDPSKLARQLMVTMAGAAATVKCFLNRDEIAVVIDDLIASWT